MSERLDKQTRKAKLHQARAKQRAAARSKLPLPNEQMRALFDILNAALPVRGCDHTLRLVQEWANQQSLPFDTLSDW